MEVQLQVPSSDWLQVYGLEAQSLTLDQLLPTLGFHQSTGRVDALQRDVSSQYGDGLFIQQKDSSGKIYNLCGANATSLAGIEHEIQETLAHLKARLQWLTSASRLYFGVIYEKKVVVVLDTCAAETSQLKPFLDVAISVIKEQLIRVDEFNLIRCSNEMELWKEGLTQTSDDTIASAVQWVEQTMPQTTPFKTNIVEGIMKALAHSEADAVYLLSHGDCTLRALDLLLEKVSPSLIPVHLAVYNCKIPQSLEKYQQLAKASGAGCHAYTPPPAPKKKKNPLVSSFSSLSSAESKSPPLSARRPPSGRRPASGQSTASTSKVAAGDVPSNPVLPSNDINSILAEIELTRNTLAEVQALRLEVNTTNQHASPVEPEINEESLTSEQWLEIHGLKAKKLRYEDLVSSLAFQHCNGIVQIPVPKYKADTQTIEMVPHAKIVHAQYCKDFVHIRWNGDKTVHVQLTGRTHRTHRAKVEGVVGKCEERLEWLKKGSRQVFGTLLESKLVIAIDSSSSLKDRLSLIKSKVRELLQEQLSQKKEFTLIHFNSEVHPWRSSLVPTSPQNLQAVEQWVQSLLAEGSTNTLGALEVAMAVPEAEAVYLLTDGRPDQPLDEVLARVQQLPKIPVHTISFNCADSKANFFLSQLAMNTGGRYYYFSEDTSDPEGPHAYQGEDIQRLEEEIRCGREQLQLADHLLSECNAVRKRGRRREGRKRTPTRKKTKGTGSGTAKKRLLSSKKWLEKNSLSALHLTLMDAFGPANIPHSPKHVPLLDKDISSKVFTSLFPLAHVTHGNEVTLINPNGVDLRQYETNLDKQISKYWGRLSKLAWSAIPDDKRSSLEEELEDAKEEGAESGEESEGRARSGAPSYKEHRIRLRQALADCGWPRVREDFDLLEKEIDLGNNFKKYLKALKKEAEKLGSRSASRKGTQSDFCDYEWSDEGEKEVVGLYSPVSNYSLMSLMKEEPPSTYPLPTPAAVKRRTPCRKLRRGQRVVVRSEDDGFYYPGVVTDYGVKGGVIVELADKKSVTAHPDHIIVVGGAGPCPVLSAGDHVLVRARSKNGPHPSAFDESCDYYLPGTVVTRPEDLRKGRARYSVLSFNNKGISCQRHGIIKVGRSKFQDMCAFIREKSSARPTKAAGSSSIRIPSIHDVADGGSRPGSGSSARHPQSHSGSRVSSAQSHSRSSVQHPQSHSGSRVTSASGSIVSSASSRSRSDSESKMPLVDQTHSHSGSRVSSARSHPESRTSPAHHPASMPHGTSHNKSEEMEKMLEQQTLQSELLEHQRRELSQMLLRQQDLEAELKTYKEAAKGLSPEPEHDNQSPAREVNTPASSVPEATVDAPPSQQQLSVGSTPRSTPSPSPLHGGEKREEKEERENGDRPTVSMLDQAVNTDVTAGTNVSVSVGDEDEDEGEDVPVTTCEQAVNTDVEKEDRGITTDPVMESKGVGTEWRSDSDDSSLGMPSSLAPSELDDLKSPLPSFSPSPIATPVLTPTPTPPRSPLLSHPKTTPTKSPEADSSGSLLDSTLTQRQLFSPEAAEQDPLINQHVLARWPDDGWYYRGLVVKHLQQMWYQVADATQDIETIHAADIIIDLQDAQKPLQTGDTVAALHPSYDFSYAPGRVTGTTTDGYHFSVELYDGTKNFLSRQEIYRLAPAKHGQDVKYLKEREKAWVGEGVVARREKDGLYTQGEVLEQMSGTLRYLIKWKDGTKQAQEIMHMFGKLTKKRGLRHGDHVLALAVPKLTVYMPATIQEREGNKLVVQFCDGQSSLVEPEQCFWLSPEYFREAVDFIAANVSSSSATSLSTVDGSEANLSAGSDLMSEYSASYLH